MVMKQLYVPLLCLPTWGGTTSPQSEGPLPTFTTDVVSCEAKAYTNYYNRTLRINNLYGLLRINTDILITF